MKICYVASIEFPEGFGGTRRFFDIYNELRKRGHEIHLVVPELGEYPSIFQAFFRCRWRIKKEFIKNIHVHRISRYITFYSNIFFTERYVRNLVKKENIDVIVAFAPTLYAGFPAYLASKTSKVPFVLDYPDPMMIGSNNLSLFGKLAERVERYLPAKSDAVFSISKEMYEEILKGRVDESKVFILYPSIDVQGFDIEIKKRKYKEIFKDKFTVTYIGSFWRVEGIRYLIEAVNTLKNKIGNINLLIVGKPTGAPDSNEDVEYLIDRYQLKNFVKLLGFVPHEDIPEILQSSDVLCAPQLDNFQNRVAFSTKIVEYLASGTPVITTPVGDLGRILKDGENAILTEPENSEALSESIWKLYKNNNLRKKVGDNGKKLAKENFDVVKIADKAERILESLIRI